MIENFVLESDVRQIVDGLGHDYLLKSFSGKKILITGGHGFLGRYFVSVFCEINKIASLNKVDPCHVTVLDNFITSNSPIKYDEDLYKNFLFVNHDVIEKFELQNHVHYIMHAAGIASPYYYRKYPLKTLEVATTGLKNVLDLAKDLHGCRLAFFSSSEIYGDPDPKHVPTKESYRGNVSCLGPRACYDESKRLGETLIRIYHEQYGVAATIIRPFNVYGPGMQKTDYRVLPNFASKILSNEPVQVYGSGNQTRTFCYITDAICGFLKTLTDGVPGEPYNIGNPNQELSMLDLVKVVEKVLGKKIDMNVVTYPDSYPADEPNRRCPDIKKAFSHFGYEPKINLENGLSRFFNWAKEAYA